MAKQLRILSVMHHVPLQSGFLAEKFIRLSHLADMHMLVWDTDQHKQTFSERYNIAHNKIHLGIYSTAGVLRNVFQLLYLVLFNAPVRNYVFRGQFTSNVKQVLRYLPIFFLKPDIIHFEFGTLAKDIAVLKQLTQAKMIVSFRGYDMYYVGLNDKSYYKDVWSLAEGFHFLGNDLKQNGIKRGYSKRGVEAIIPPAIDTHFFKANTEAKQESSIFKIISVGRLTWRKGYDHALLAMKFLKQRGVQFQYTIIGWGEHLQAIQFMIAEFGLEEEVILKGALNKDEIKIALDEADIFLQASVSEGFCNAVIEAQAMGLPVVCTDAGGLVENIENNVTGFIVPKWNAEAIADKIEWCYNNRHALKQMGDQGIVRAKQFYNIEDQAKAFLDLYNKVHES